jgi:hypothetical protein
MSAERDDQHDAVDALIDESARSLTKGEPSVALRARVRSVIDAAPRRRPWAWQPALAGAVVVVAVSAWLLMRNAPVTPSSEGAPPVITSTAPPETRAQRDEPSPLAGAGQAKQPERQRAPLVIISAERVTPLADPLPAIEPIEIEPVESSAMAAIERMPAPMPLEIEQLMIEQLFE